MPPMPTIAEWHIVLSGFLQRAGDVNGVVLIWNELRRLVHGRPDAVAQLHSWNANLVDLAELIARTRPSEEMPRVHIYGYSWGGQSAVNLARELGRRGVPVDRLVLSDAVYRHWYKLGWWRAFVPWLKIRVPDTVRRVTHFRQQQSLPMGHIVQAENPGLTTVDPVVLLRVDHKWMDDAAEFRCACLEAAKGSAADDFYVSNCNALESGVSPEWPRSESPVTG